MLTRALLKVKVAVQWQDVVNSTHWQEKCLSALYYLQPLSKCIKHAKLKTPLTALKHQILPVINNIYGHRLLKSRLICTPPPQVLMTTQEWVTLKQGLLRCSHRPLPSGPGVFLLCQCPTLELDTWSHLSSRRRCRGAGSGLPQRGSLTVPTTPLLFLGWTQLRQVSLIITVSIFQMGMILCSKAGR